MRYPMKAIAPQDRVSRFLRQTLVRSMEGVFFVLISALFTLSGAAIFL